MVVFWRLQVNTEKIANVVHDGKTYAVAPVVILREGVHNGSLGKVYHSPEELEKNVQTWNGIPLPIGHPRNNEGQFVSANSPEVIDMVSVGRLYHAEYRTGPPRIVGELWIDIDKANNIDPKVLQDLNAGHLEVSTGMWHETLESTGMWGNEEYDFIARDYRPDHVALLPGGKGACSFEDGCGAPRVNEEVPKVPDAVKALKEEKIKSYELSHRGILDKLQQEIDKMDRPNTFHFVEDVYDNDFIYGITSAEPSEVPKYYRRGYSISRDDKVVLADENTLEEVERNITVEYSPVTNEPNTEVIMTKKERIQALIDCPKNSLEEKDRAMLENVPDETLDLMEKFIPDESAATGNKNDPAPATPAANATPVQPTPAPAVNQSQDPAQPVQKNPLNMNDWLDGAPPELAALVRSSLAVNEKRKGVLVNEIGKNPRNPWTTEQLNAMPIEELERLAHFAQVPVDYSLNSGARPQATNPLEGLEVMEELPELTQDNGGK
jgi:hypothetical protein